MVVCTLFCASGSLLAKTTNDNFHITYAKPIELTKQALSGSDDNFRLTFYAYGREFNLNLHKNARFISSLPNVLQQNNIAVYAGNIENVDNSWVRMTRINGRYSGAIYNGEELFMVDNGQIVAESVDASLKSGMASADTVIYRVADVIDASSCAADEGDRKSVV